MGPRSCNLIISFEWVVKDKRVVFLCREVIREEVGEGVGVFFLNLCRKFDSSEVDFTRPEVG